MGGKGRVGQKAGLEPAAELWYNNRKRLLRLIEIIYHNAASRLW